MELVLGIVICYFLVGGLIMLVLSREYKFSLYTALFMICFLPIGMLRYCFKRLFGKID